MAGGVTINLCLLDRAQCVYNVNVTRKANKPCDGAVNTFRDS